MKTNISRTLFFCLCITILVISCNVFDGDNYVTATVFLEISDVDVPETATVNQDVGIYLSMAATNGCYRNLKITLNKMDETHFIFLGSALYENKGACTLSLVPLDTVIYFKPTATGKYYFQTNQSPFQVRSDTIVIN